jgi:transcriptional regulator with XRE-family HTH domain
MVSGGPALKRAIHVARAKAGITSDMQLALRAHVSYDTLMNWFGGKTVPRGHELEKVALALGTSIWVLQAAYDGRDPEPPPLTDAIAELTREIQALVKEMREDRERGEDAASALLKAAEVLGSRPTPSATGESTMPAAPGGTAG